MMKASRWNILLAVGFCGAVGFFLVPLGNVQAELVKAPSLPSATQDQIPLEPTGTSSSTQPISVCFEVVYSNDVVNLRSILTDFTSRTPLVIKPVANKSKATGLQMGSRLDRVITQSRCLTSLIAVVAHPIHSHAPPFLG